MRVKVYQGTGKWYAFTDKDVSAVPPAHGPWELISTIDMKRGEPQDLLGILVDQALDAVEAGEIYLTEAGFKIEVTRPPRK